MKRETIGKIALELLNKEPDTRNPIEIEHELHKDYEKNIFECIERGKKDHEDNFFVVVITKKEPLMPNVLRHYYFNRLSCPSPDYDQAVYHYKRDIDTIDFLWVVPSREASFTLVENKTQVAPTEYELLDFVLKFADGTLFKLAKKLNGEADDSALLVTE